MTVIDVIGKQSHDDNLEKEINGGYVEQTEEEKPGGAEVEGKQTIPFHQWQRLTMECLSHLGGHIAGIAEFLAQQRHEALELWRNLLLFTRVVDIRLLEGSFYPVRVSRHLLIDLLLSLAVIEFAAFLALQEEEVYLIVVVGQT